MRKRPELIFLHRLPSLAEVSILDSLENVVSIRVRRIFFPVFLIISKEVSLQYYFKHLSFFGRIKLLYLKFSEFMMLSKSFTFRQLLFPYTVEMSYEHIRYPIKVRGIDESDVWISRTAILEGVTPNRESEEIDWDLIRGRDEFLMFIFKLKSLQNRNHFDPQLGLEINDLGLKRIAKSNELWRFENVQLVHSKNVLQNQDLLFPSYSSKFTFSGWPSYYPYHNNNRLRLIPPSIQRSYDSGVFFQLDNNWFHFLIEAMSSLVKFESEIRNQNIVLPKRTYRQISEALQLFSPASFIYTDFLEEINFSHLSVIDFSHAIGADFKDREDEIHQLSRFINSKIKPRKNKKSEKIFLKRNSNLFRNLINRDLLEQYLSEIGYTCLDLGEATFGEQVSIISNASFIVAETGATLTNVIFAPPNCHVLELKPEGSDSVYGSLIEILDLRYESVQTKEVGSGNYRIEMRDLQRLDL